MKEIEREDDLSDLAFLQKHYFSPVKDYLLRKVGNITAIHADDLPILEFRTLRHMYGKFLGERSG